MYSVLKIVLSKLFEKKFLEFYSEDIGFKSELGYWLPHRRFFMNFLVTLIPID